MTTPLERLRNALSTPAKYFSESPSCKCWIDASRYMELASAAEAVLAEPQAHSDHAALEELRAWLMARTAANPPIDRVLEQIDAMLARAPQPQAEGCTCDGCGARFLDDVNISDADWASIHSSAPGGLLCGACIVRKVSGIPASLNSAPPQPQPTQEPSDAAKEWHGDKMPMVTKASDAAKEWSERVRKAANRLVHVVSKSGDATDARLCLDDIISEAVAHWDAGAEGSWYAQECVRLGEQCDAMRVEVARLRERYCTREEMQELSAERDALREQVDQLKARKTVYLAEEKAACVEEAVSMVERDSNQRQEIVELREVIAKQRSVIETLARLLAEKERA